MAINKVITYRTIGNHHLRGFIYYIELVFVLLDG